VAIRETLVALKVKAEPVVMRLIMMVMVKPTVLTLTAVETKLASRLAE